MEATLKISLDGGQTFETTEVGGALGAICHLDEVSNNDEKFKLQLSAKVIKDMLGKGMFDDLIGSGEAIELVKVV